MTPVDLHILFEYEPFFGALCERVSRKPITTLFLQIAGETRATADVIWALVKGRWPPPGFRCSQLNGEPQDWRIKNLYLQEIKTTQYDIIADQDIVLEELH